MFYQEYLIVRLCNCHPVACIAIHTISSFDVISLAPHYTRQTTKAIVENKTTSTTEQATLL